ncbi:DNA primase small subunit [Culex quinquefasciatus]|uniref:DNA primase n=4 Tax=Culex pipiens complex TaxID=518105 RepID=B0VZL4_CULQU|nr:DNA primase small subunit [Culex quinquefasciatus]EDS31751.1 DNA primase small subunit [Culex quinquefasciatus]|eukprot:XP_001841898.1 DNA primase small subunit [Culex quinquefasciatus]
MPQPMETSQKAEDKFDPASLNDLLPLYYRRLFPHLQFYRWMSYGLSEPSVFTNREFSFTLQDDIYIRYQSFENQSELEKEICAKNPSKIDIGAVFNVRPKDHRASTVMKPVQRELVFDIDMTDYDEIRTCCSEANVCPKCWKFMTIACKIIDAALREDFGFEHLLWVFSGRRGIHCWISDKVARYLDTRGRAAVAEYLNILISGGEGTVTKVNINTDRMHHAVKRAHRIIEPYFEEICLVDQDMFGTPNGLRKLLAMVQDDGARMDLDKKLKPHEGDSKAIWKAFVNFFEARRITGKNRNRKLRHVVEEVQLAVTYPRIDINVSKGFNHLLKAPFCVHPKTGKVCIPFNPNVADKFDPTQVPTITGLLNEINAFDEKLSADGETERSRIKDYKKTSMFKGTVIFEEFLRKLEQTFKGKAILASDRKMEF